VLAVGDIKKEVALARIDGNWKVVNKCFAHTAADMPTGCRAAFLRRFALKASSSTSETNLLRRADPDRRFGQRADAHPHSMSADRHYR
jgi:hypothetical protein